MTDLPQTRRTTLELPSKLAAQLDTYIDWGMRKAVFTRLSEALIDLIERDGKIQIYLLLAGRMELRLKERKDE